MSVLSDIGAHFHIACAETAIQELPVKNLTLSFALAISICFKYGNNCSISIHYPRVLAISAGRMPCTFKIGPQMAVFVNLGSNN